MNLRNSWDEYSIIHFPLTSDSVSYLRPWTPLVSYAVAIVCDVREITINPCPSDIAWVRC